MPLPKMVIQIPNRSNPRMDGANRTHGLRRSMASIISERCTAWSCRSAGSPKTMSVVRHQFMLELYVCGHFQSHLLLRGTLAPAWRASERPIAIACLRLVTLLPERPLLRVPRLRSCIARLTFCEAFLPYCLLFFLAMAVLL